MIMINTTYILNDYITYNAVISIKKHSRVV